MENGGIEVSVRGRLLAAPPVQIVRTFL